MSLDDEILKILLGKRIFNIHTERELGLREFATMALITHAQLSRIEAGDIDLQITTVEKIARGFQMDRLKLGDFTGIIVTKNEANANIERRRKVAEEKAKRKAGKS